LGRDFSAPRSGMRALEPEMIRQIQNVVSAFACSTLVEQAFRQTCVTLSLGVDNCFKSLTGKLAHVTFCNRKYLRLDWSSGTSRRCRILD
jgi:hypothetical protein